MGLTAENVAAKYDVSKADQDAFAVRSHARAAAAQDAGRFKAEIVPVPVRVDKVKGTKITSETVMYEDGRTDSPRHHPGGPGQAEARLQAGRLGHRGQRFALLGRGLGAAADE